MSRDLPEGSADPRLVEAVTGRYDMRSNLKARSRWGLAAVGAAVLAAAALGGLGYAGDDRPRPVPPPSEEDISALRSAALELSARNGDPSPSRMRIVAGPRLAVVDRLMGGAEVDTDQDVYVVALEGNFVGHEARIPPGRAKPTGTGLALVFDASTKVLVDWAILNSSPALEDFGTPRDMRP